jgi:hypothetical protein
MQKLAGSSQSKFIGSSWMLCSEKECSGSGVQHHIKMVMIAEVSSAALIKSGRKALQNISTHCYHFKTVLLLKHPTWDMNCPPLVSYCGMAINKWEQSYKSSLILQSIWSSPAELTGDWLALAYVPCALASFMPLPSSADTLCTLMVYQ